MVTSVQSCIAAAGMLYSLPSSSPSSLVVAVSPQLGFSARSSFTGSIAATSFSTVYTTDVLSTTLIPSIMTGDPITTMTLLEAPNTTIVLPSGFSNVSLGPWEGIGATSIVTSTVLGPWTTMHSAAKTAIDMATPTATATDQNAVGFATVVNYCVNTIYLWPVDQNRNPQIPIQIQPGYTYTEQYYFPLAGGVSLKLNTENNIAGNITQFEYTIDHQYGGFIWYDGSNVNCLPGSCPFDQNGIHLAGNLATCASRTCTPGTVNCTGFYLHPTDDESAMMGCSWSANVTMSLCYPNAMQR